MTLPHRRGKTIAIDTARLDRTILPDYRYTTGANLGAFPSRMGVSLGSAPSGGYDGASSERS